MILNGREIAAQVAQNLSTNLEDLHLQTVGGKVYASEHAARDTEVARLACGGHGWYPLPFFGTRADLFRRHARPCWTRGNIQSNFTFEDIRRGDLCNLSPDWKSCSETLEEVW